MFKILLFISISSYLQEHKILAMKDKSEEKMLFSIYVYTKNVLDTR